MGILTGGGDCPGLNAVIRAVVRRAAGEREVLGFRDGWAGVMHGDAVPLDLDNTRGLLHRGGTILGTSRTNPFKEDGGAERIAATLEANDVGCLIAIGGEDTLGVARRLGEHGVDVVGVPKTIDNDLAGTDFTFGFHTAVQIATDAIDRLHTTAESHNRVMVVEVMGRHAGWIAVYSGMAGGADAILVPERPFDVDEVCDRIRRRHGAGRTFSIVVVSEGAAPKDGMEAHAGCGHGRLRPRAPGRHRRGAGACDRGANRLRVADDDPRARPARRHPHRVRPRAGDALRRGRDGRGRGGGVRADGGAARHRDRAGRRWTRRCASPSCSTPSLYETAEVFFG